jgi:hypothetical protein
VISGYHQAEEVTGLAEQAKGGLEVRIDVN